MIESLRSSASKFLAFFAGCTFGVGFAVGFVMVELFRSAQTIADPSLSRIEQSAAAAAKDVGYTCGVLVFICVIVIYRMIYKGAELLFLARALYILSFIALIAAISAGVFFIMFHI